jgi:NAD(P)-dependent dehydrogenase (short-subunit alcohol dehydrogenase family)
MWSLSDRNVIVTGAASGIGRAIALACSEQAAEVWIADIDEDAGARVSRGIEAEGRRAHFAKVDVTDAAAVEAFAEACPVPDVLVNNAGVGHVGDLLKTSAEDFDRLIDINVRGPFNLCRAFVPKMLQRGRGSVVNIASIAGVVAVADRLAYTTTKFAVVGLTKALALDHSHTGVRFNAVCPGRVETDFVQKMVAQYPDPEAAYREMASTQLNGRLVRPEEVAAAVVYLASDASEMITGSTLMIDGGWSAGK